ELQVAVQGGTYTRRTNTHCFGVESNREVGFLTISGRPIGRNGAAAGGGLQFVDLQTIAGDGQLAVHGGNGNWRTLNGQAGIHNTNVALGLGLSDGASRAEVDFHFS